MHHFDDMAKALASGLTRRQALRRVGGGLAGALLASLGPGKAWGAGADKTCSVYCKNTLGLKGGAASKCVSSCKRCMASGGTACGASGCCAAGLGCCNGSCTDLTTTSNCGECGRVCPADDCRAATCTNGICGTTPINEGESCYNGIGTCHNGVCGDGAGVCGEWGGHNPPSNPCGGSGCYCFTTVEGIDVCFNFNSRCGAACTSSADCPVGSSCTNLYPACGGVPGNCFPLCSEAPF